MLDCKRLGEAADTLERVHRPDGGGCKCCVIYFWFLPAWGELSLVSVDEVAVSA